MPVDCYAHGYQQLHAKPCSWCARQVGYAITTVPEDFHMHRGVKRVYEQRRNMVDSGEGIDWGMAEALAFGTLISEGEGPGFGLLAWVPFSLQMIRAASGTW